MRYFELWVLALAWVFWATTVLLMGSSQTHSPRSLRGLWRRVTAAAYDAAVVVLLRLAVMAARPLAVNPDRASRWQSILRSCHLVQFSYWKTSDSSEPKTQEDLFRGIAWTYTSPPTPKRRPGVSALSGYTYPYE